jgi:hypothetical protein
VADTPAAQAAGPPAGRLPLKARLFLAAVGAALGLVGGRFVGARLHFESGAGILTIVIFGGAGMLAEVLAGTLLGDRLLAQDSTGRSRHSGRNPGINR